MARRARRARGSNQFLRPRDGLAGKDRARHHDHGLDRIRRALRTLCERPGRVLDMPQKRNPISSELMLAASKAVRQHAGLMLDAMVQDLERATGPWHAEWMAIPESFVLSAGALHQAKFALQGLVVDEQQMTKNLGISRGLIVAEAVMMGLAPEMGRQQAHDVVYDACRLANENNMTLADALSADPQVSTRIDRATIERLTSPDNYLGLAPEMVDRVLAAFPR